MNSKEYVISADAGGTFLDLVLVGQSGRISVGKSLHTPKTPEKGIMEAVSIAAKGMDTTAEEVLKNCRLVFHGTTVTTNGMIERNGVRTGLICTKGFEDTLAIGRVKARTEGLDQYQITHYTRNDPPSPIVSSTDIRGIAERMDGTGTVVVPLDEEELLQAAKALAAEGVKAIVVAFLHSYTNAAHEARAREIINRDLPDIDVIISTDVASVLGEFERVVEV